MRRVLIAFALVVLLVTTAGADVVIKEKIGTHSYMGVSFAEGEEVTYIKGDRIRTESTFKRVGMMSSAVPKQEIPVVTIIRLDKGIIWHVNTEDETYMQVSMKPEETLEETGDTRYEIKDVAVTKTDKKKTIAGYECQGVNLQMFTEMMRDGEQVFQTSDILFWMAPETDDLKEIQRAWEEVIDATGKDLGGPLLTDAMAKVSQTLEDFEGVPLGMDIIFEIPLPEDEVSSAEMEEAMKMMKGFVKGKESAGKAKPEGEGTDLAEGEGEEPGEAAEAGEAEEIPPNQMRISREIVSIKTGPLDDSLFEIPEGFKKAQAIRRW